MKKTIVLFITVFTFFCARAQDREISGKVTSSEDGGPLPGATVLVKGTTIGTSSDAQGMYKINVPAGNQTLTFSFLGFVAKDMAIDDKTTINVTLAPDKKMLQEVVAVGYGVQPKAEVTGAIASIKGEAVSNAPVQSFDQALAGQASGVNITVPNGVLNNKPVIRVRGYNSITSSSYPLIVVDGIPIWTDDVSGNSAGNNPLGDINPADIESMDILKDASATAIYGSRAANGVMLVTTKKGKAGGKPGARVSLNSWMGVTKVTRLPELLNAEQFKEIKNEALVNAGRTAAFFDNFDANGNPINTNWYDVVYRTAFAHSNHLSISGASEQTSYYFSTGYSNQEGFIKNNEFERKSVRFNVDQKVAKIIKVGALINYTDNFNSAPNTGSLPGQGFNSAGLARIAFITTPLVAPYTNTGGYNITTSNSIPFGNIKSGSGIGVGIWNPVPILDLNKFTSQSDHIMSNLFAEVDILKNLKFKTSYMMDNLAVEDISFSSPLHGDGFTNKGVANNVTGKVNRWALTNTLNFMHSFAEKHNISLLAGYEELYTTRNFWGGSRQSLADDYFETYQGNYLTTNPPVGNFQTESGFRSYFGRITYDFSKKYFFTTSFRRDGYSALSEGNKFGNFGGVSLGWVISEESFYKNMGLSQNVNKVKLRGSYGKVGNIGIPDFGSLSLYSSGLYGDINTLVYAQAGNSELKWETSTKLDAGLEIGFLNNRFQLELGYFNNDINGLVLASPQAPSKGIPGNSILLNIGSMYNKGFEVSFLSVNIDNEFISWTSNTNLTLLNNEVTALADGNADIVGITSTLERTNITRVGEPLGSLYAVKTNGVNPANGQRIFLDKSGREVQYSHPGKWTYVSDGSTAPAISLATDGVPVARSIPKWYGGFNNTLKFLEGTIDLRMNFVFSGGNYIYNGSQAGMRDQRFWNNHTDVMDRWKPDKTDGTIPKVVFGDNISNGSAFPIDENIEKGDFLKFKTASAGYTFKEKSFGNTGISSLRLYAQVTNVYVLTKYTGYDPEVSTNGNSNLTPGVDRNTAPQGRTFTLGMNLEF